MHAPRSRRQVCADSGIRVLIVSEGAAAVAVALCRMSGSPVVPLFPAAEVETLVSTCCFAGYFSSRAITVLESGTAAKQVQSKKTEQPGKQTLHSPPFDFEIL